MLQVFDDKKGMTWLRVYSQHVLPVAHEEEGLHAIFCIHCKL
jgi:hypothetical protein